MTAIENSKTRPLSAFLFALGIPNVGSKTAKTSPNDLARWRRFARRHAKN
ncbi:MAG: hypothetical protein R2912_07355 [Eubacteriales bacterium]